MKIFMIGGTGLLGSAAATELIERGHEVSTISLPPLPEGANLPKEMKIHLGNYMELSDAELSKYLKGCDGLVFAAGVDERVKGPPPIYDLFEKYNITPLKRLLALAKESGIKRTVILGSYFSHFAKTRPELELAKHNPYIRSRIDQENMAFSFADDKFHVAILELPYIFGVQPGRKPVWTFLVEMLRDMKGVTLYPKGGTTMVTVRQVGEAIAGAIEQPSNKNAIAWPIGWYNMTWKELLTIMQNYMGLSGRKIFTIPKWMFNLNLKKMEKQEQANNIESGLSLKKLSDIQYSEFFIDKSAGCVQLGVTPDDIDRAIGDSVKLSLEALDQKDAKLVDMKGE